MNFSELGQIQANTVERPKPLPEGHYLAQFAGPMAEHKAKTGNLAMRFQFKLVGAGEDVDAEELQAAGGIPTDKTFTIDFWMSPDSRYRFTDFACKAQGLSDDLNLIELAEKLLEENKPFSIQNKHRTGDNPEDVYNDWQNPAAAE